jgi:uncharacterized protein involved in type VI secretion and phage assembly
MKREARLPRETDAMIDELGKCGEDAVYATEEVVNETRFEEVRAQGRLVRETSKVRTLSSGAGIPSRTV